MGISYSEYLDEPSHITDWNIAFMKAESDEIEREQRKLAAKQEAERLR